MALCSGFQTMVGGKPLPLFGSQTICNLHCQYKIQNVGFVVFGFTFSFFVTSAQSPVLSACLATSFCRHSFCFMFKQWPRVRYCITVNNGKHDNLT